MTERVTIRVDDKAAEILDKADNKSEKVREALLSHETAETGDTAGLTDLQRQGLAALLDLSHEIDGAADGQIGKEIAESKLAQRTQIDGAAVVRRIIKPLLRSGHVRMAVGRSALNVYRTPPETERETRDGLTESMTASSHSSDCPPHKTLPDGVCVRCEEQVEEPETETTETDTADIDVMADPRECDAKGCHKMLVGDRSTCWDCRTDAGETA